jgi:hypothetical protein
MIVDFRGGILWGQSENRYRERLKEDNPQMSYKTTEEECEIMDSDSGSIIHPEIASHRITRFPR